MNTTSNIKTKITSLEGNRQRLDGGAMFGNVPSQVWKGWINPDELGRIPLACRSLLIETQNHKILCEAGVGNFFEPKLAERFGIENPEKHILKESLKIHGISENSITHVILSHLHFDHAGGLLPSYEEMQNPDFQLLFPNAKYIISKGSLERALTPHPRDKASFVSELNSKLVNSKRLYTVEPKDNKNFNAIADCKIKHIDPSNIPHDLPNELCFFFSEGHTPGQMLTVFLGNDKNAVFCGDLVPGTPWVHLPITMGYDRFPELLIDEKKLLYSSLDLSKTIFFYTHDPVYVGSSIYSDAKKYLFADTLRKIQSLEI